MYYAIILLNKFCDYSNARLERVFFYERILASIDFYSVFSIDPSSMADNWIHRVFFISLFIYCGVET